MDRDTTTMVLVTLLVLLGAACFLNSPGNQAQDPNSVLSVVQGDVGLQAVNPTADSNSPIQKVQFLKDKERPALRINPFKSASDSMSSVPAIQPSPVAIPEAIAQPAAIYQSSSMPNGGSHPDRQLTRLPPAPVEMPALAVELPTANQVPGREELLPEINNPASEAFAQLDSIEQALLANDPYQPASSGSESNRMADAGMLPALKSGMDSLQTMAGDAVQAATDMIADGTDAVTNYVDELPPMIEPMVEPTMEPMVRMVEPMAERMNQPVFEPQVAASSELPLMAVPQSLKPTQDLHQPLEADPGWAVENNTSPVTRESILNIDMPRHVEARTMSMLRDATKLADRGALCAARLQFMRVLRITCQTLDTKLGQPVHARALANGMKALEEAEDFALTDDNPEADIHLIGYIQGHRTPVLKDADPNQITALMAMQRYYKYAYQQLALAGNNERVASEGLFALGRIEAMLAEEDVAVRGGGPKALALYHSALTVNSRNGRAANELGVILAKRGRARDALYVLNQAAAVRPTQDVLNNLAIVHSQLSDPVGAKRISQQAEQLAAADGNSGDKGNILWVTPQEFAAISEGDSIRPKIAKSPANSRPRSPKESARPPVRTATRPNTGGTWDF